MWAGNTRDIICEYIVCLSFSISWHPKFTKQNRKKCQMFCKEKHTINDLQKMIILF